MKHLNLHIIIMCLVAYLGSMATASAQSDTVIIKTPAMDVEVGQEICIPFTVENFDSLGGFQFALRWDPETYEYTIRNLGPLPNVRINDSLIHDGSLRVVWTNNDLTGQTLADGDTLMMICFVVQSDRDPEIQLDYQMVPEFIGANPADMRPYKFDLGEISITNLLDCGLIPICEQSVTVQYYDSIEIHAKDLISNIDYMAACHGFDKDSILIAHRGYPGLPSLSFGCDDITIPFTEVDLLRPDGSILCSTKIKWLLSDRYRNCGSRDECAVMAMACPETVAYVMTPMDTFIITPSMLLANYETLSQCRGFSIHDYKVINRNEADATPQSELLFTCENIKLPQNDIAIVGPDGEMCYVNMIWYGQCDNENTKPCNASNQCISSMEVLFEPGTVVSMSDIVADIDNLNACYDPAAYSYKLINLSQPNAEYGDSIVFNCDNIYSPTYVGLVVIDNRLTNPTTTAQVICKTQIDWNIPDNLDNCGNGQRSCIDPSRCTQVSITVDSVFTRMDYTSLLDMTDAPDSCDDVQYSNQYTSLTLEGSNSASSFLIGCVDYAAEQEIPMSVVKQNVNGGTLIIADWCISELSMDSVASVCNPDNVPDGFVPINISNNVALTMELNGNPLTPNGPYQHLMVRTQILDIFNELKPVVSTAIGTQATTLDMVLLSSALINDAADAMVAIAGDIDYSGSLTTKDVIAMRRHILGLEINESIGQPFMIEEQFDRSDLDPFDFDNSFSKYQFDGPSFDRTSLTFEIGVYGDLNNSFVIKSNVRSAESKQILADDRMVKKGESIAIPLQLSEADLQALSLSLSADGLSINRIESDYTGTTLLTNAIDDQHHNLSFFSPGAPKAFKIVVHATALEDGRLSDMINISNDILAEAIYSDLSRDDVELAWTTTLDKGPEEVCYYPNPTAQSLIIEASEHYVGGTAEVYSILGQRLHSADITARHLELPVHELGAKGMILIRIKNDQYQKTFRVEVL